MKKQWLVKIFSVRSVLSFLLVLSLGYASFCCYYKIKYWGFSLSPKEMTDIWTVEAKVSFEANGGDVSVVLSTPSNHDNFEILSEEIVAKNYMVKQDNVNNVLEFKGSNKSGKQNLYYRLNIYDDFNKEPKGVMAPQKIESRRITLFVTMI